MATLLADMAVGLLPIIIGLRTTAGSMEDAKKSLGQHWLTDKTSLLAMVEAADVKPGDTVLEIGPGHGSLTRELVSAGAKVLAVEKDEQLAAKLSVQGVQIIAGDILQFDFGQLAPSYKLVANIPYYISGHLLRVLGETANKPTKAALLVQKEVAERVCAGTGQMSLLSVSIQLFYKPRLGRLVPAKLFSPPPKVDSQILVLDCLDAPAFADLDVTKYMRLVRAGFSEKRKKLRSSLAGGLGVSKTQADDLLAKAGIDGNLRAQDLSLGDWHKLYQVHL